MLAPNLLTPDEGALVLKFVAYTVFAMSGGLMGYILRTVDAKEAIQWSRAALEGFSAGFVGLLVYLACRGTGLSEEWIGVLVGVCGWLGANASIRILEIMVYEKLGIAKFYKGRQQRVGFDDEEPIRRPRLPARVLPEDEEEPMPRRIIRKEEE